MTRVLKSIFIFLLIIDAAFTFATDNKNLDSLSTVLHNSKGDTETVIVLGKIGEALNRTDPVEAARQMTALANALGAQAMPADLSGHSTWPRGPWR